MPLTWKIFLDFRRPASSAELALSCLCLGQTHTRGDIGTKRLLRWSWIVWIRCLKVCSFCRPKAPDNFSRCWGEPSLSRPWAYIPFEEILAMDGQGCRFCTTICPHHDVGRYWYTGSFFFFFFFWSCWFALNPVSGSKKTESKVILVDEACVRFRMGIYETRYELLRFYGKELVK